MSRISLVVVVESVPFNSSTVIASSTSIGWLAGFRMTVIRGMAGGRWWWWPGWWWQQVAVEGESEGEKEQREDEHRPTAYHPAHSAMMKRLHPQPRPQRVRHHRRRGRRVCGCGTLQHWDGVCLQV